VDPGLTVPLPVQPPAEAPISAQFYDPGVTTAMPPQPYQPPPAAYAPQPPADAYPGYAASPAAPYPVAYPAPPAPPAKSPSMVPLMIGIGALIALAVAGFVLWQQGYLTKWIGGGSTAPTSTVGAGGKVTTPTPPPVQPTTTTPLPEEPDTAALSDSESYDAIVAEWETITTLRAAFGEKFPGDTKGTGWIYDTWSKQIGAKSSRPARVALAAEATDWVDRLSAEQTRFTAVEISDRYASWKNDYIEIYALFIERAEVYAATSEYAIDNPTISKGNEPWRAVQDGKIGGKRAASVVLEDLQHYIAEEVPPEAP
jgi:hypothetical protein